MIRYVLLLFVFWLLSAFDYIEKYEYWLFMIQNHNFLHYLWLLLLIAYYDYLLFIMYVIFIFY